jgi:(E)-4-hydroxy-3-methyl-but-2-enyl pyrophosphate reductase
MDVEIAADSGFCFGVRRALSLIARARRASGRPFYSLGPLIHNPQTVERLRERYNVTPITGLHEARGGLVIVRTHGVSPAVYSEAEAQGIELLDATCPFVLRVQRQARELADKGYSVVVLGESHHPEVEAVLAHAGGQALVVSGVQDLPAELGGRIGLVVQTTQEPASLGALASELATRCEELRLHNTICQATRRRQSSALEVASRSDVMIVVGGNNSANTRRLWQICRRQGKPCYHIEVREELDPRWFAGMEKVGVTGGASTPKAEIRGVAEAITQMGPPDH